MTLVIIQNLILKCDEDHSYYEKQRLHLQLLKQFLGWLLKSLPGAPIGRAFCIFRKSNTYNDGKISGVNKQP